jgi:tRNA(fMet)-specific endonuclease VapC
MTQVMLDTNAVSDILNGYVVASLLADYDDVLLSPIVLGELFFMVEKSSQKKKNGQNLEMLLDGWSILHIDHMTARYYARVHADLMAKGKVAKIADMWIAAHAWQYGIPLISRDRHFDAIETITVIRWPTPPT